jgi:hypothetical protein
VQQLFLNLFTEEGTQIDESDEQSANAKLDAHVDLLDSARIIRVA